MNVVVSAARRTPIGSFFGQFADTPVPVLGAAAIQAVLGDSGLASDDIDEVTMGCVLTAAVGQAPARQAALAAGLPVSVPCTTLDKVCGSGMRSVMMAHDMIRAGSANVVIAGGMESMSNAPYLLPKARRGLRFGHASLLDHMLYDGLQNANDGEAMGHFGQICADEHDFSRQAMDDYARESVLRARHAIESGAFADELCAVEIRKRDKFITVAQDEEPFRGDIERIATLKPAFRSDGSVTAASSASLADGAAALLLMGEEDARQRGCPILANIVAQVSHAQTPETFTTAPIGALGKILARSGWQANEVDLYEINEAFAPVVMAAMAAHRLDHAQVNVHGGACALGHPIGTSGARILVTLIHALRKQGKQRGVAVLCIGGGEATAMAVQCD